MATWIGFLADERWESSSANLANGKGGSTSR